MKLVAQLRAAFLVLLALSLGSAVLTLWLLHQSRSHYQRLGVSHALHAAYLSLESHAYRLFKQYGDAILIGDTGQRRGKTALEEAIEADVREIRRLIVEGERRGDARRESADRALRDIERAVATLTRDLDRFSPTGTGELASDWGRLSELLNEDIDGAFRSTLQGALAAERERVDRIRASIATDFRRQLAVTLVFATLSMLATRAVVWRLTTRVARPIHRLAGGVRRIAEGRHDEPVALSGDDELSEIGATLDELAGRIAAHNARLETEKRALTRAVAERTERLSLMLEDARRADASRQRMIADVSHELRTPLTIIRGEADVVLRDSRSSEGAYREALNRIREAATHTGRLVDDLLFVARTEAGELPLELGEVDLARVVGDTLAAFGPDVELVSSAPPAPVRGDARRIAQALLVLLENARHHGGAPVSVTLGTDAGGNRIDVEDRGAGMSAHEKEHAFRRFFRGSNAAGRYRDGAGLGLPVARAIARAHGGDVTLADRAGGGLVATLSLPAARSPEPVA